jgi:hypothetical protein
MVGNANEKSARNVFVETNFTKSLTNREQTTTQDSTNSVGRNRQTEVRNLELKMGPDQKLPDPPWLQFSQPGADGSVAQIKGQY